ncbi:MAG: glycosyltransferase family 39 protein [Methylococcales bacterium]
MTRSINKDKLSFIETMKDELRLFTFFAVYLIAWTLCAQFLPTASELDSTEQVVWSQSWQWGYYKHPPLPSLLLYVLNALFDGPSKGLNAFAAQGCNILALFYVWLLAKQMLSRKLAIVAVLITSLIAYHNFRAFSFNHNTVSLPFTAAAFYYFYRALQVPERLLNWFLLGLVCGLALLTKYSILLVIASFFILLLWYRLFKNIPVMLGLLLSIAVFLVVISPHVYWLAENNWRPFHYLQDKLTVSGNIASILFGFIATQLIRLSFAVPTLIGIWVFIKTGRISKVELNSGNSPDQASFDRHFLWIILFTPLTLALLQLFLLGSELNSNWISAFFLPSGILLTVIFFKDWDSTQLLKRVSLLTWITQAVILIFFFVFAVIYPSQVGSASRLTFPSQALANKVAEIWRIQQQTPLTIMITDYWSGGTVSLYMRPEPMVLIDNSIEKSPWVTEQDVQACGALILVNQAEMTEDFKLLLDQVAIKGEFILPWGYAPKGKDLHYLWAIKTSEPNQIACRLSQNTSPD